MAITLMIAIIVTTLTLFHCSSAQQNGDLRLVDDRPPVVNFDDGPRGRLEIFLNGKWGTVCAQQTSRLYDFGQIVCRQLGYGGLTSITGVDQLGFGSGNSTQPVWLDAETLNCDHNRFHVLQCGHGDFGAINCGHAQDVAVACSTRKSFIAVCDEESDEDYNYNYFGTPCDGYIRLEGGQYASEGRVEIFFYSHWGTVCSEGFGQNEADTVCRQLGYTNAANFGTLSIPGPADRPVWLTGVSCLDSFRSLRSCQYSAPGSSNCDHSQDISVQCTYDVSLPGVIGLQGIYSFREFTPPPTVATTTSDPTITARTSDLNATETTSDLTTTAPTSDSTLALSIVVPLSVLVPYSVLVLFVSMCVLAVYFLRKKKVEMIHECPTIEDKKVTDFV